jgi:hypothetical protein
MAERRTLVDAIQSQPANDEQTASQEISPADLAAERQFLHSAKSTLRSTAMKTAATNAAGVSLNTRIHPDIAEALKRASLERKLQNLKPNSFREILEQALVPWLKAHGHLP